MHEKASWSRSNVNSSSRRYQAMPARIFNFEFEPASHIYTNRNAKNAQCHVYMYMYMYNITHKNVTRVVVDETTARNNSHHGQYLLRCEMCCACRCVQLQRCVLFHRVLCCDMCCRNGCCMRRMECEWPSCCGMCQCGLNHHCLGFFKMDGWFMHVNWV